MTKHTRTILKREANFSNLTLVFFFLVMVVLFLAQRIAHYYF